VSYNVKPEKAGVVTLSIIGACVLVFFACVAAPDLAMTLAFPPRGPLCSPN
jgi:uncharacterized MnhB-related membrane protein